MFCFSLFFLLESSFFVSFYILLGREPLSNRMNETFCCHKDVFQWVFINGCRKRIVSSI